MKKKIFKRLVLLFSFLLIMMTVIIGILFSVIFSKQTEDLHVEEVTHRGEIIQQTMTDYFSENQSNESTGNRRNQHGAMMGYGAYLNFINQIAGDSVWVLDAELNSLTSSGHHNSAAAEKELSPESRALAEKVLQDKQQQVVKSGGFFQLKSVASAFPILVNNQLAGVVVIVSDVANIHQNQINGYLILLFSLLIALAASILLSVQLAKRFVSPIKEMEHYTGQLIAEEYPAPLTINTGDELNELADKLSILSQRLEKAEQERKDKEQSEKEFLSQISHELRTPVTVMKSSLEALADELITSPEEQQMYHSQLLKEAGYLEHLVNDLLELSRLQSVEFSLIFETVDPLEVIEDSIRGYRRKMAEKNQQLVVDNQLKTPVYLEGDHVRLVQLFKNLLDNAHKYGKKDSSIEVSISAEENMLCFRFENQTSNSDIALKKEELFQAFHRGNRKPEEGTGLGLAICQQIVRRHHGQIELNPHGGNKVTVTIWLPIKE
ncbi:sensor histidine kinase [Enterococcus sp. LJL128]